MDEGQLWKLLDSLQAQIRAFDTKAQVALGLDSLMAGLMGTEIVRAVDLSSWHIDGSTAWFCAFAGSSVISLLVSVVFAIRTALPRLHLKQPRSHFFFCHLVELYGRRFGEAAKSLISLSDKQMVQELATQVQGDNRPTSVYADNRKSPDLVQVRGVLYYSSAGFFLLQLEQACSVLPPSVAPVTNAGVPAGKDGNRVDELGTR